MDCVICPLSQADQWANLQIDVCDKIEAVDSTIMNLIANGNDFSCSMLLLPSDEETPFEETPFGEITLPQSLKDKNFKASYLARIGLELGLEWSHKMRIEANAHQ